MANALLKVEGLTAGYGEIQVLWDIGFEVAAGAITCIVGSNGAGKTTLLRTLSGLVEARSGSVMFDGRAITGVSPEAVLSAGIAHVPEGRRLFRGLTVRDNLMLGAYLRRDPDAEIQRDLEWVHSLFPILADRRAQDATTLSGGEQQMCAIGRGLMAKPRLLMIDELSLGLAPRAIEKLAEALKEINQRGLTILLVEQDVMTALELATHGVVIESGRTTLAASSAELAEHPRVREAYLGV
jgi:branched-chain amino acid transport system ATP-binding protein